MNANPETDEEKRKCLKNIYLNKMLDQLNNYVQRTSLISSGQVGEIVSQLILVMAFDDAVHSSPNHAELYAYSYPVTVRDFLSSLFGEKLFKSMKTMPSDRFLNGLVCFTHFIRKLNDLNYKDTMLKFVARCAAGQFKPNNESVDLFIPVILEDNKLTYIFIEVLL